MKFTEREEEIIKEAQLRMILSLPEVIGNIFMHQMFQKKKAMEFYNKNRDLLKDTDIVGDVLREIQERGDMSLSEVIEKIGPVVRDRKKAMEKLNLVPTVPDDLTFKTDFGEL